MFYSHSFNMGKYLVFLLLLASCANPKKLHKMMDKLPVASAKECSTRFPIKETIDTLVVSDSTILQAYQDEYGRLNLVIDSLLNAGCDTLYVDKIKEVIKTLPAKTNTKIVVKTQKSTAELQVVKDSCDALFKGIMAVNENNATIINNLTQSNGKLKAQNNWLWVIIVASTAWIFRKRVLSLVKHIA